jgi:TRAP-type mannitol/chloroaromatic compound transport system substrate-binding protein
MRFQSTWAAKDIFHEYALDYAKKVNDMTGGDLRIEVLPAGAVVPAFGLLDAVSKGTLDGGHGVLVYHYGKQTALALWGSGPGYAMDANMLLLAWHRYGGGKELLSKLYTSIGANVVSFPHGPMPTQPLGWFKNPVTKADDLKGVKFRTVGISIDVFTGLGAAVNALPGGEIVSAMDRGLLDVRSSTMRRRTASWASRMSPRSACCRVIIRMPSSSRSCSTRRSMTRCRKR